MDLYIDEFNYFFKFSTGYYDSNSDDPRYIFYAMCHNLKLHNKQVVSFIYCRKLNIVDNMLAMLEKHAYNLEGKVLERTLLLQEEKKKTEALLLRMLPK